MKVVRDSPKGTRRFTESHDTPRLQPSGATSPCQSVHWETQVKMTMQGELDGKENKEGSFWKDM